MTDEDAATVTGAVLIGLNIVTVAGRFYTRWFTKAGFGWDDWTILIAMMTGILPGALTIWANSVSKTGPAAASNFDPDYVFTPSDILYTKITFSTTVLYFLITCTTKLSILLLFHRTFAVSRSFKIKIFAAVAVVVVFWISATVADLLNCIPLEWTWKNGNADPRYCINYNTFWLVTGIFESVIDLVILSLPFSIISKLQLGRSKKYGVAGVFLLGAFVLVSGVVKVILSYLPDSREPYFARSALWTTVHLYLGIVCANLVPSWPLYHRLMRLSTGSWVRLSSLSMRWYSLSGGQSSMNRGVMPPRGLREQIQEYDRSEDAEVGRAEYEFAMYGQNDHIIDDWTVHSKGISRAKGRLT
ncbi:integral membrane protein [Xylaria sp. FL0043]|nr:integral membrane protein [Xylaria sp. FL0043]